MIMHNSKKPSMGKSEDKTTQVSNTAKVYAESKTYIRTHLHKKCKNKDYRNRAILVSKTSDALPIELPKPVILKDFCITFFLCLFFYPKTGNRPSKICSYHTRSNDKLRYTTVNWQSITGFLWSNQCHAEKKGVI